MIVIILPPAYISPLQIQILISNTYKVDFIIISSHPHSHCSGGDLPSKCDQNKSANFFPELKTQSLK